MADDFPDLHHKLCKKLAHLITGFYHLNTKSDETDLIVRNTVETYEKEMDKMVNAANSLIEKTIKENAQAVDLLEIRDAYRAFKNKIEEDKASAVKEFNAFKEAMAEKERNIQEEAQKQVHIHQGEVENLKEKLWYMKKLVEKVVRYEIKFDEGEMKAKEMEQQKLKQELEERNKDFGELKMRYLELERAYRELEDFHLMSEKMTTHWSRELVDNNTEGSNGRPEEWEAELLRKKVVEQERIIFTLRKAIGQENGFSDGEDATSIDYGGTSQREMGLLAASERMIKEKDMEIQSLKDRINTGGDDRLQIKIEEYENRLKEAGREHRKLIETLHTEYSENIAEMEAQLERDKSRWEAIVQGMRTTLESRNEYIAGLEEKLKSLQDVQQRMDEEAQKSSRSQRNEALLNQEIERLNQLLIDTKTQSEKDLKAEKENAQNEINRLKEELKADKEKALEALNQEISKLRNYNAQKDEKIKELEAEIVRLKDLPAEKLDEKARELAEEYQNKVNELSQRHNHTLRELIEKHDEKVDHINKNYETELEEIRQELKREKELVAKMKDEDKNSEIQNVKKEYEATLQKISKSYDLQLEEKVSEYEALLKGKDLELSNLRKDVDKVKEELKSDLEKLEKRQKNYKELETTVKEQKSTIERLEEELQERQLEEEGVGSPYEAELKKLKEGVYIDKDKDKIIKDHLKYAKTVEKKLNDLRRQSEERVQMLIDRYNELVEIFEKRPSRTEDLALIRQLQEEGLGREEEYRRLSEKLKPSHSDYLRKDDYKPNSQQGMGTAGTTASGDKIKKNAGKNATGVAPTNASSTLPPISISQFSIHMRSPPASNGLMTSKKFFK